MIDRARLARLLLCRLTKAMPPLGEGTVDHNRPAGAKPAPDRHRAMNMDTWYELVLREMSDLNGVANELLREADEVSRARDHAEDEQQ